MSSAAAVTDCVVLHIDRNAMARVLTAEPKLSALFPKYRLRRIIRYQDELVDQLFQLQRKADGRGFSS